MSILELGAWLFQLGCDNGWVPSVHPITDLEEVHGQKGHHLQVQSSKRVVRRVSNIFEKCESLWSRFVDSLVESQSKDNLSE